MCYPIRDFTAAALIRGILFLSTKSSSGGVNTCNMGILSYLLPTAISSKQVTFVQTFRTLEMRLPLFSR